VATLTGDISASLAAERLLSGLMTAFAAFALLISATGIVGLLSYSVQLKRRDIGLRVALGATFDAGKLSMMLDTGTPVSRLFPPFRRDYPDFSSREGCRTARGCRRACR
jgi:hypothetical protein